MGCTCIGTSEGLYNAHESYQKRELFVKINPQRHVLLLTCVFDVFGEVPFHAVLLTSIYYIYYITL